MNAKDAMINYEVRHVTYEQARRRENKPICRYCFVPCDPRSRAYRACQLCEYCYDEQPPLTTKPKEILCQPN
jgi:hypothetical protein